MDDLKNQNPQLFSTRWEEAVDFFAKKQKPTLG